MRCEIKEWKLDFCAHIKVTIVFLGKCVDLDDNYIVSIEDNKNVQ